MRLIVVFAVLSVLLVPGTLAAKISYTFGNGASEVSGVYDIGGAATISLVGNAKEAEASNHLSAFGPFSTSKTADSYNGLAHAKSEFSVTGSIAETEYEFTSNANFYGTAETHVSLTSHNAETINAKASAWNGNGDCAESSMLVSSPMGGASLYDYYNEAIGYMPGYSDPESCVRTRQSCDWADARDAEYGNVFTSQYAKSGDGSWSRVTLNLPYGTIYSPYPYTYDETSAQAYASKVSNDGQGPGRTLAMQSTKAFGLDYSAPVGYYFARAQAHYAPNVLDNSGNNNGFYRRISGRNPTVSDSDYYSTGTNIIGQYAATHYKDAKATNEYQFLPPNLPN